MVSFLIGATRIPYGDSILQMLRDKKTISKIRRFLKNKIFL